MDTKQMYKILTQRQGQDPQLSWQCRWQLSVFYWTGPGWNRIETKRKQHEHCNKEFFIAHTHGKMRSVFFVRINIYHSDERDSST